MNLPLAGRRIGLLTASASRQGGGVFESVVAQARLIRDQGGIPHVFALDDADARQDRERFEGCPVSLARVVGPRQIGYAPRLSAMLDAANLDCLHLHGIWMHPSLAGAIWASRSGRPYVISPHGMLDPWITARGRWKKALARLCYERESWRRANRFHALTDQEARDIANETGRSDAVIIPNAAPGTAPPDPAPRQPLIAYLGRIHAKKNLISLIQAWTGLDRPADARLLIAGWGDDADVAELKTAIAAAGNSVAFLGPQFSAAKADLLSRARFMVLPSLSEGLPMAMLEAWAHATPTIMTRACNLDSGINAGAALECGFSAESIAAALDRGLGLDQAAWQTMSRAARQLAEGPFSGKTIAASWADIYSDLMEDSARS